MLKVNITLCFQSFITIIIKQLAYKMHIHFQTHSSPPPHYSPDSVTIVSSEQVEFSVNASSLPVTSSIRGSLVQGTL